MQPGGTLGLKSFMEIPEFGFVAILISLIAIVVVPTTGRLHVQ